MRRRRIAAWGVHLLTASGALASLLALLAVGDARWRAALAWMAVAMVIDSVDGMLARAVAVTRVLPRFDGVLLDNIVDYVGYVLVPAVFLLHSGLLPEGAGLPVGAAILLSSAYQFCQADAKTVDHFFKGFPSFWNVAAFYLWFGGLPRAVNLTVLLVLVAGVFVPLEWAYPSRMTRLRAITLGATVAWGVSVAAVLAVAEPGGGTLVTASFAYVPFYVAVSAWLSATRPPRPPAGDPR